MSPDSLSADSRSPPADQEVRHDWTVTEAMRLFALPFNDLLFAAHSVHRRHHDANAVQLSTLLNVKTGGCPEDCGYCAQSVHFPTGLKAEKMMALPEVLDAARAAKQAGAGRFCMGAAWRSPNARDLAKMCELVEGVRGLGLETCVTAGMLTDDQARTLKSSGLDYYNHNLDSSESFYAKVVTTRTYQDRLDTLGHVRDAGIKICSGGILGLGESTDDRASMLVTLANLPEHPESVPINMLVKIEGTPLGGNTTLDPFDFVRTIAVARILMPRSYVRFAAGRLETDEGLQALAFFAGANSIFYGERLLTTPNPADADDRRLLDRLGIRPLDASH
ncbi:MAG TPA: biotin synthase BioB [Alphaproteobacteria bacterium]|jgi:biotin synthase|nr:biotin synthase BioB [Alphaproteobacteria bacterium]